MLKIEGLKLDPGDDWNRLTAEAARLLKIKEKDLLTFRILRRSIDAREGVSEVYSVEVTCKDEPAVLKRCHSKKVSVCRPSAPYPLPVPMGSAPVVRPVVVGAGPAGLFCTYILAAAGLRPILLERGKPVEQRREDVERFRTTGILDPSSNVQFGEGGAGAFSDGKLNTGTKDACHRFILEQLVECGAPEDILIDAKPHVGTDYLFRVLQVLRRRLMDLGAELRFETTLTDLTITGGVITAITVDGPAGREILPCRTLALCPGHSARDTFEMLHRNGVPMEPKAFAVGVRIEHLQKACDAAQYKQYAGHPGLPASTYKLACHLPGGRSVFSFCVCPGGEVMAAASEPGRLVTNGMSEFARAKENINGAMLVNVTPEDFCGDGPLAGVEFQRRLEEAAFRAGGENYHAPAQRAGDLLAGRPSKGPGKVKPTYLPGVHWTDLGTCLPPFILDSLKEALPILGRKLKGYDDPDAVLTAVESRSSSPVRIPRGENRESAVGGLYPCGEGAGYAGGILSAAADGIHTAEAICNYYRSTESE